MSLAKLFLSGLLVAGGLILGAFTLHGYFDPEWAQKRALAAKAGLAERPQDAAAINVFQGRGAKFESATRVEAPEPEAKVRPVAVFPAKVPARPEPKSVEPKSAEPKSAEPKSAETKSAEARAGQAKAAAKPEAKTKTADRPPPADKAKAAPQQASFEWLSLKQLFGGN